MEPRLLTFPMLRPRAVPEPARLTANVQEAGISSVATAGASAHLDKFAPLTGRSRAVSRAGWRVALAAATFLATLGLCAPRAARAQDAPRAPASLNGGGADTHLFRPAVDSKGFFSVNGSRILGANDISF